MKITQTVAALAKPIVEARGCSLWDVEYVREGADYILRVAIDKEGGVDIDDCEAISRALDPILDEHDPIPDRYQFEVCSAGLERQLKRPSDFERYLGEPVLVKLYRPRDGQNSARSANSCIRSPAMSTSMRSAMPLLQACRSLLADDALFVLYSCHTPGFTPITMRNQLDIVVGGKRGAGRLAGAEDLRPRAARHGRGA